MGNLNNNVGFVATLLVKAYTERRFAITDFDAGAKAQGAAGIDIVAKTGDGKMIVGEPEDNQALSARIRRATAYDDPQGSKPACAHHS